MAILLYTEAMKYSPLNLAMGEGENMAVSAANRFQKMIDNFLKYFLNCFLIWWLHRTHFQYNGFRTYHFYMIGPRLVSLKSPTQL